MPRLLIRSGKDPFTPVSPETTLTQDVFNSNSGNYLFQHAVWKSLAVDGVDLVSNGTLSERRTPEPSDPHRINEEFDHFVVPLANAFRPQFVDQLDRLSDLVEGLTIPVTVTGVGAQAAHGQSIESMAAVDEQVQRFVGLVLDRSATIGVRGEYTRDYLTHLGFPADSIEVIGCPSLFLHGRHHEVHRKVDAVGPGSAMALNLTPEVPGIGAFATAQAARYPHLTYVPQDNHDLRLMLWGDPFPHVHDLSVPVHLDHPLYRDDRMRMFVDTWTWYDFLAQQDFAYGTRFHGNVAALLAGTPAMLLAHDSRTLELAQHHRMPHRVSAELSADLSAEELYAATDLAEFNAAMPANFDRYTAFLETNGLQHIWSGEASTAQFDERLASAELPPAVRPLSAGVDEVAHRLRWLRDGMVLDITRHRGRYEYPFEQPLWHGAGSRHARLQRKGLEARKATDAKVVEARKDADAKITRQREVIAKLERRLDQLERLQRATLTARFRRLAGRVKRRLLRS